MWRPSRKWKSIGRRGAVRVKRLVCAHDCGLIVNPEALRGTIQANLIQSMGRALEGRSDLRP